MKTRLLIYSLILGTSILFGSACKQLSVNWEPFKSVEGKFKVELPGKPVLSVEKVPSAIGNLKLYNYRCEMSNTLSNNKVYMISYTDYPMLENVNWEDTAIISMTLNGSAKGMMSKTEGVLKKDSSIFIDKYEGKEIVFDAKNNGTMHTATCRIYLVKNRLYLLQVWSALDKNNNPACGRFMKSFNLI